MAVRRVRRRARGRPVIAETGRTVPSLRSVAESDAFLDPRRSPPTAGFLDAVEHMRHLPTVSTWPEIEDAANGILENGMYLPNQRPEQVAAEIDATRRRRSSRAPSTRAAEGARAARRAYDSRPMAPHPLARAARLVTAAGVALLFLLPLVFLLAGSLRRPGPAAAADARAPPRPRRHRQLRRGGRPRRPRSRDAQLVGRVRADRAARRRRRRASRGSRSRSSRRGSPGRCSRSRSRR